MAAEKPTKPRRDLRARLGKTITPKTAGQEAAEAATTAPVVPGAASAAAEEDAPDTAAPVAAAPVAAPTPAATPAPRIKPAAGGGIAAPPAAIAAPNPFAPSGGGIAAPPFARPAAAPEPEAPADPFAAKPVTQQVVRVEFDDRLVKDVEVGKSRWYILVAAMGIVFVVAGGIGVTMGQTMKENELFDRTVYDAQQIYQSVNTASSTMEQAQQQMNAIIQSAAGSQAGERPAPNFEAIERLRALEKPFDASAFTNKNYNALRPDIVHDLFAYLNNVERLWVEFTNLANMTLQEGARAELTEALSGLGDTQQYGAVLRRLDDGRLVASLAFIEEIPPDAEHPNPRISAKPNRGAQGIALEVYQGHIAEGDGQDEVEAPAIGTSRQYAILIDAADSRGVLIEQTGPAGRYLAKIRDINQLLVSTIEIQGRLLTGIEGALREAGATTTPTE
jgi:hypothetical protein